MRSGGISAVNIHQLNQQGVEGRSISRPNIPVGEIPVLGQPGMLLRIEGLVLLAGALLL